MQATLLKKKPNDSVTAGRLLAEPVPAAKTRAAGAIIDSARSAATIDRRP
jgi:hypothetical protein